MVLPVTLCGYCDALELYILMNVLLFTGITWVCGDIGQVSLDVYNPMPFELKVSKMVRSQMVRSQFTTRDLRGRFLIELPCKGQTEYSYILRTVLIYTSFSCRFFV